ncbi:MAG: TIGR02206 family membrane protein [Corynebacterium sp.]|nr:TIGR02206 family membrane protein [Corynebacterium sp.]
MRPPRLASLTLPPISVYSPKKGNHFPQWGGAHLIMAVTTIVVTGICIVAARSLAPATLARQLIGWLLLSLSISWFVYTNLPGKYDPAESLPLHLTDWLRVISPLALITNSRKLTAISFYWGLLLNLQAIITPSLTYIHPKYLQFVEYWLTHIALFVIPAVLTWGFDYRPSWKDWRFIVVFSHGWAGMTGIFNKLTGGNYGYLAGKSGEKSALDFFGPWPWYIGTLSVLCCSIWAGMTAPFAGTLRE